MSKEVSKTEQSHNKTFGSKLGAVTGVVIMACINALIIAITARIVLWII